MAWTVTLARKAQKQYERLPKQARDMVTLLVRDMEESGPVRGDWPNYSKLTGDTHHCHVRKGKPCYVAVWEVIDKKIRLIEVQYVGTHERAPY